MERTISLPSIWKRFSSPKTELYQFPQTDELEPLDEVRPGETLIQEPQALESFTPDVELEPNDEPEAVSTPFNYAQIQADQILSAAEQQAEEILERARQEAQEDAARLREKAREEGWEAGHADGVLCGTAQALEEGRKERAEKLSELEAGVSRFLERANAAVDKQMEQNVDELKDLAIAVAEKVIAVSLKSSSEVIGRMIQSAVDRRKRREWVRIYVAECDGLSMKLSPQLVTALASISEQVRIIPMADDETGTCIIEMPDEIIDASAATQINNIRSMLSDIPAGDGGSSPILGGSGYVPPHDSTGL